MNLFLNTPEPMRRLRAITARQNASEMLAALQRTGVLHPEQSAGVDGVDREAIDREKGRVDALLSEIDEVLAWAPQGEVINVQDRSEAAFTRASGDISKETHRLCASLTARHRHEKRLRQEEAHWLLLAQIASKLSGPLGLSTHDLGFTGKHLFSRLALVSAAEAESVIPRLQSLSPLCETVDLPAETALFLIAETRNKSEIEDLVRRHGRFIEAPGDGCPLNDLPEMARSAMARLNRKRSALVEEILERTDAHLEPLLLSREALLSERDRLSLLQQVSASDHLTFIEGWIPECTTGETVDRLRREVPCSHIETRPAAPGESPPSKLRNPAALRPFEVILNLFATPGYREWDPTPLIAYSFALFFGIMLSDAVYGLLLFLLAFWGLPKLTDDPEAEGFRMFRRLVCICAGVAVAGGILTGTYLGDFATRFFDAPVLALSTTIHGIFSDPMRFIAVALLIGFVHVNFGHLLMLIRGVRERKPYAVIGRSALFLVQIAAIPWIMRLLNFGVPGVGGFAYTLSLYLLAAGILLVIVASLWERGRFLGSILWVFDLSGILGDIMSYARLAGVGLATYYLAYSFNMMATLIANMLPEGLIRTVIGGAIIVVILLIGHVLNLLLSSITCFVHSLRLCFVEFLFKFYEGGGRPYAPFQLRRRRRLPVRSTTAASF